MEIMNLLDDSIIGSWEYDIKKDVILLSRGSAHIYYNENKEKTVDIEDFFMVLSAKSSQLLSKVLTEDRGEKVMFVQQVRCIDGTHRKVLVIVASGFGLAKNRQGVSIDVTKIL